MHRSIKSIGLLLVLLVPAVELVAHGAIRANVPSMEDWRSAADLVRAAHQEGDQVVVAPAWADPVLRWVLGDQISLRSAGASDLAPYRRLWALSIRGADPPEAPGASPALDRSMGSVRVRRWDLGPSPVLFDMVASLEEAEVSYVERGRERRCSWRERGVPRGGGLSKGPIKPAELFECDPRRSWAWVGRTMLADLEFEPHHCVWSHPLGAEPVHVTYRDVPLGERIVFHGGVYYVAERKENGGPIDVRISAGGQEVGKMTLRHGDGWKRMEALTRPAAAAEKEPDATGDVRFSFTTSNPYHRMFCWTATVRQGERQPAE